MGTVPPVFEGQSRVLGASHPHRVARAAGKWLILDWKTNRIAPDEIETLRAQYQPQVAAYWKAITEMTGAAAEAAIYSTATGKLVKCEANELDGEWERLSNRV